MALAKVSVIIPAYNGEEYIGEAIQSVLDQSYQNFEIIVVDDVSSDKTSQVVNQFTDSRIHYILHTENAGANIARNTGIRASDGEIIAFLDQDDLFHLEKLQKHVSFYKDHPEIGFTYNNRFNLDHISNGIRTIWQPPINITLADLVLGYPLSPSDMVIKREWLMRGGMWDDAKSFNGGEITLAGRLYMAGCKFAKLDSALNYRRYQSGRVFSNLATKCEAEVASQEKIFSDPRCPKEIRAMRNIAFSNTYKAFAFLALKQEETELGREYLQEAIRLNPEMLDNNARGVLNFLIHNCISDENVDHAALLKLVFAQLPQEMGSLSEQYDWAVARGYLMKGVRAVIWDRSEAGKEYFSKAIELGAEVDISFLQEVTYQLLNYDNEFGGAATQAILRKLIPYFRQAGAQRMDRQLEAHFYFNRAMTHYHARRYKDVVPNVIHTLRNDPRYLTNQGILSITARSLWKNAKHGLGF